MPATMTRIALCPRDGEEMSLLHRTTDMDAWFCDACGEHTTVIRRGQRVPEAPLDALAASEVRWVEREAPRLHGRIDDEEGG